MHIHALYSGPTVTCSPYIEAPNPAFESGRADEQRVFGLRRQQCAAQRER